MTEDILPQELQKIIEILRKISEITGEEFNFHHLQELSDTILPVSNALLYYLQFIYYVLKIGEGLEKEIDPIKFSSAPLREKLPDFLQKFSKSIMNDVGRREALKGLIEIFVQLDIAPSFQILYETMSISHNDPFEEQIRSKFKEAFDKAYLINEGAIVKLFIDLCKSIANQEKLLDLLSFSSYNKLGIGSQNIKDITLLDFLELIFNKKGKLIGYLEDSKVKDKNGLTLLRMDSHNDIFFGNDQVGFILDSKIYYREYPTFVISKEKGIILDPEGNVILVLRGDLKKIGDLEYFGITTTFLESFWWKKVVVLAST